MQLHTLFRRHGDHLLPSNGITSALLKNNTREFVGAEVIESDTVKLNMILHFLPVVIIVEPYCINEFVGLRGFDSFGRQALRR